jgi:acyl-CoA synthetase (NDP forming)
LSKADDPPIIVTSQVNILSLQEDLNAVVTWEFFFLNTASGNRITTKSMAGYKTIQNLLSQKGLPFFTFYTKGNKPVKAVMKHLPNNTSSEDITVALQELGYEVISVKQITAKRPSPENGVTLVPLPLFLFTLVRNQKSLDIFKASSLCNIIVKVEAYKYKSGVTQCYNC